MSEMRHNMHMAKQLQLVVLLAVASLVHPAAGETLQGRWKLLAAEDLRANGEVGRLPWGAHPMGSIVVGAAGVICRSCRPTRRRSRPDSRWETR